MNPPKGIKPNPHIVDQYKDLCEECLNKISEATEKLSRLDLMRPIRVAKKFSKLLCRSCTNKVVKKLGG